MGMRIGRLAACVAALTLSMWAGATSAGAFADGLQGCPGSGFQYLGELAFPVAAEGFADDCQVSVGDARIDVRTGTPEISLGVGDGISVDRHGHENHLSLSAGPLFDFTHRSGLISAVSDSAGGRWAISYDSSGRVVKIVGLTGTLSVSYDAAGNLTHIASDDGRSQTFGYDGHGRITTWGDSPGGDSATVSYNAAGHLTTLVTVITQTDPTQTFTYDGAGNVVTWTNADGISRTLTYAHDSLGHVTSAKVGANVDSTFTYTAAHALASVVGALNAPIASFSYDVAGRLIGVQGSTPSQAEAFAYDSAGRLSTTTENSMTNTLSYDAFGRLLTLKTPTGITVSVSYVPAPTATTGRPRNVHAKQATLTGTVDPQLAPTVFRFQFGRTTSYGNSTPAFALTPRSSPVSVSVRLIGLKPGTTYHYRLLVSNEDGSAAGLDRSLRTPPVRCVVPRLIGDSLNAARQALARSHCRLGHVTRPHHIARHAKLRVKSQHPSPGTVRPKGAKVGVKLGVV